MGSTGRRLAAVTAGLLLLAPGCGFDPDRGTAARSQVEAPDPVEPDEDPADEGGYDPTVDDEQQLRELMSARAQAVDDRDLRAFRATVDPQQPKLMKSQTVLFRNMVQLPLVSLRYQVATTYLVPAKVPGKDPVLHPQVVEQLQIVGTMTRPVSNALDLTFVKRGDQWLVGAERPPGAKGSVEDPQERPWFGVPISVRHEGQLTVLVDAAIADELPGLVGAVRDGIRRDADILGIGHDEQVLVDATSNGEAEKFGAGVKEEVGAITFAIVSTDLDGTARDIAGVAIKINPDHVADLVDESRLLWHELTHYLLFDHIGSSPVWLAEGVAAWSEYQPVELAGLVIPDELFDRLDRREHKLPTKGLFYGDPDENYLIGQAAVEYLVAQGGTEKLLELMKAYDKLYQGADTDSVTPKALRRVYDLSLREVTEGAWDHLAQLHH